MNKIIGYALVASVLLPTVALAADFRVGEQFSTSVKDAQSGNVYFAGKTVTSHAPVGGDVTVAGGTVLIDGPVSSDVLATGGTVTLVSNVSGDVRVMGGTVLVEGIVGGDVVAAGGTVNVGGTGVGGDVAIAGGTVRIDAPVAGKVIVRGGDVYINSAIQGTVDIEADTVTLGKDAVIAGDLTYKASKELVREDGATVNGQLHFEQYEKRDTSRAAMAAIFSVWVLGKFLSLLACALIVGLVFRRYSKQVIEKALARPWAEILRGLIIAIVLPVLSVILFATLVGIPFGILGLLSFGALLVISCILTPIIVGSVAYRYFFKKESEVSWRSILLGTALVSVVGLVPFLGGIVLALLGLLTIGVVATMKWDVMQQWR